MAVYCLTGPQMDLDLMYQMEDEGVILIPVTGEELEFAIQQLAPGNYTVAF